MRPNQRSTPPGPADDEKPWVRTHTPRPDELSRETFEFIAAIDEYKRKHMRSFLSDKENPRLVHLGNAPHPWVAGTHWQIFWPQP